MRLPPELRIIHEPARLGILGLLYRQTDLGFTALRDALDLTPGNLAAHCARLAGSGLVAPRDALTRGGFERRFQITPHGVACFERYLETLGRFLDASRAAGSGAGEAAIAPPHGRPAGPGPAPA